MMYHLFPKVDIYTLTSVLDVWLLLLFFTINLLRPQFLYITTLLSQLIQIFLGRKG